MHKVREGLKEDCGTMTERAKMIELRPAKEGTSVICDVAKTEANIKKTG